MIVGFLVSSSALGQAGLTLFVAGAVYLMRAKTRRVETHANEHTVELLERIDTLQKLLAADGYTRRRADRPTGVDQPTGGS